MLDRLHRLYRETRLTLMRPGTQLTRGQRFIRYCIDLARHARDELRDDAASTMAAALTYRTIFGFVPVVVMMLIVFKAFGGFSDTQQGLADKLYEALDIDVSADAYDEKLENHPILSADPEAMPSWLGPAFESLAQLANEDPELANARNNAELRMLLDEALTELTARTNTLSVRSIGVVGMLILIWAALGLIVTTEKTFNVIFKAPQGRPWHIRIPIYWAVITLGPVLAWGSFYLTNQLIEAGEGRWLIGPMLGWLNRFMALAVTWLLFLLLFKLLPNARVAMRPAMIGALVSALAWEGMKAALRWYIENAVVSSTNSALYGSLALIPLMLFWVYVTWLVVLAGLEVTHILQTLPAGRIGHAPFAAHAHSGAGRAMRDPWLVIPVMSAVAESFERGETTSVDRIAERLDAPIKPIDRLVDELTRRGLLHQLPNDDGPAELTLALPPSKIRIADLIDSSGAMGDRDNESEAMPGHTLLQQLAAAQNQALADATLAGETTADDTTARRRGGDG